MKIRKSENIGCCIPEKGHKMFQNLKIDRCRANISLIFHNENGQIPSDRKLQPHCVGKLYENQPIRGCFTFCNGENANLVPKNRKSRKKSGG